MDLKRVFDLSEYDIFTSDTVRRRAVVIADPKQGEVRPTVLCSEELKKDLLAGDWSRVTTAIDLRKNVLRNEVKVNRAKADKAETGAPRVPGPLRLFVERRCVLDPDLSVSTVKLFKAYEQWLREAYDPPLEGRKQFFHRALKRYYTSVKRKKDRYDGGRHKFYGIALRESPGGK